MLWTFLSHRIPGLTSGLAAGMIALGCAASLEAQDRRIDFEEALETELFDRCRKLYWSGAYDDCIALCKAAISGEREGFLLRWLLVESLLAKGEADQAHAVFEELRGIDGDSIPLLMLGHSTSVATGKGEEALELLREVNRLAREKPKSSLSSEALVALGEAAYLLGADPEKVLKAYMYEARKMGEKYPFSYLAAGRLALEKRDFGLAADEFRAGIKAYRGDPDLHHGLAAAFFPDDRKRANELLDTVFELNPRHAEGLVLRAQHFIDAERPLEAQTVLDEALKVNPRHPEAWALQAVIAYFDNDEEAARLAREEGLALWADNPRVDHLIGNCISRKRRFAEGAEFQKRALERDADFLPARMQLAQDLLRLGKEDEAWEMVDGVREADEYNVMAFNLATLRDEMKEYATLETDDFVVRMPKKEAKVYGDRAIEILKEAKGVLCEKYGLVIDEPVLVEFFPEEQDFAVRTFGVPGGGGLLGVCFGSVITMNSPGGLTAGSNNWEATLWHEFCHVVTLGLTKNKMPRWLSEGISVYEELQRDSAWGQHMTPRYRRMILEEDGLRPIMEISSLFMNPQSGEELMFAYYESALVVEFFIERFGLEKLRDLLRALGEGTTVDAAIVEHLSPLAPLEKSFRKFVEDRAKALGPEVDWSDPEFDVLDPAAVAAFVKKNPRHFAARKLHALHLLEAEKWDEAREAAEELRDLYPEDAEEDNAYLILAKTHRELGQEEEELRILEELAERSAEATPAYLRLMEAAMEEENWERAASNARKQMSVNPFLPRSHYCLGCAHEAEGDRETAVKSFQTVLLLGAEKPGEVHYRLARLEKKSDPAAARKHVLDALAEAPRFRDAQKLLVELAGRGEEREVIRGR